MKLKQKLTEEEIRELVHLWCSQAGDHWFRQLKNHVTYCPRIPEPERTTYCCSTYLFEADSEVDMTLYRLWEKGQIDMNELIKEAVEKYEYDKDN